MLLAQTAQLLHDLKTSSARLETPPNELIKQLSRAGMLDLAARALSDTIALGIEPDAETYHHIIAAHVRRQHAASLDAALQFYTDMKHAGIVPHVATFRILFRALAKKTTPADTTAFETMKHLYADMHIVRVTPGAMTYGVFITTCARINSYRTALGQFDDSRDAGVRLADSVYWTLLRMASRARDVGSMQRVLDTACGRHGYKMAVDTYQFVIDAYLAVSDFRRARAAVVEMVQGGGGHVSEVACNAFMRQALRPEAEVEEGGGPTAAMDVYQLLPVEKRKSLDPAVLFSLLPHLVQMHPQRTDAALSVFYDDLLARGRVPTEAVAQKFVDALVRPLESGENRGDQPAAAAAATATAAATVLAKLRSFDVPIRNNQVNIVAKAAIITNRLSDAKLLIHACCTAHEPIDLDVYKLYMHAMLSQRDIVSVLDVYDRIGGIARDADAPVPTRGATQVFRLARMTFTAILACLDQWVVTQNRKSKESAEFYAACLLARDAVTRCVDLMGSDKHLRDGCARHLEVSRAAVKALWMKRIRHFAEKDGGLATVERAREILTDMARLYPDLADAACYAPVMSGLIGMGRCAEALELRNEMLSARHQDTSETLRIAFGVWMETDDLNAARAALRCAPVEIMLRNAEEDDFCGRLALAFAEKARFDEASDVIDTAKRQGVPMTWSLLDAEVQALFQRDRAQNSLRLFLEFYWRKPTTAISVRSRPALQPATMYTLLETALDASEEVKENSNAALIVSAICETAHHYPADFYRSCATLLLRAPSQSDSASRLIYATAEAGYTPDRKIVTELLGRFADAGDARKAWRLFRAVWVDHLNNAAVLADGTQTVVDEELEVEEDDRVVSAAADEHFALVKRALHAAQQPDQGATAVENAISKWRNYEDLSSRASLRTRVVLNDDISDITRPGVVRSLPFTPHATINRLRHLINARESDAADGAEPSAAKSLLVTRLAMCLLGKSRTTGVPPDLIPYILLANLRRRQLVVRACVDSMLRIPAVGEGYLWAVVDTLRERGDVSGVEILARHAARHVNGGKFLTAWAEKWSADGSIHGVVLLMALLKAIRAFPGVVDDATRSELAVACARAAVRRTTSGDYAASSPSSSPSSQSNVAQQVQWMRARGFEFTHESQLLALLSECKKRDFNLRHRTMFEQLVDVLHAATETIKPDAGGGGGAPSFKPTAATLATLLATAIPMQRDARAARTLWARLVRTFGVNPDEGCFRHLIRVLGNGGEAEQRAVMLAARRKGMAGGLTKGQTDETLKPGQLEDPGELVTPPETQFMHIQNAYTWTGAPSAHLKSTR
ncbi:hypothetical protein HDU87_007043 [Geranomyces variabilis]|uniref:Uncharacterized protein n=1 Tax=Geranomyces variabilis TaxID=109894 RepID=A0AAD5TEU2_9FUNG|nr:hypothetical protein HDU87_007043 [Geranomyces variabilis]